MGKGDKRTKKGKRTAGSYGNSRPRKATSTIVAEVKPAAKPKKKAVKKKTAEPVAEVAAEETTPKAGEDSGDKAEA